MPSTDHPDSASPQTPNGALEVEWTAREQDHRDVKQVEASRDHALRTVEAPAEERAALEARRATRSAAAVPTPGASGLRAGGPPVSDATHCQHGGGTEAEHPMEMGFGHNVAPPSDPLASLPWWTVNEQGERVKKRQPLASPPPDPRCNPETGTFDADRAPAQRETWVDASETVGEWTQPRENCPTCGAALLRNLLGMKWCSALGCDFADYPRHLTNSAAPRAPSDASLDAAMQSPPLVGAAGRAVTDGAVAATEAGGQELDCGICGRPRDQHTGVQRCCPIDPTYRPRASRSAGEGERLDGVCFLFVQDGCVLMEQCPKKAQVFGVGEWFIPGGKIEPGEAPDVACRREIREELGIIVESLHSLPIIEGSPVGRVHPNTGTRFLMRPFLARGWGAVPSRTVDGDVRLRWVPIAEALDSPVPQVRMMVAAAARAAEGSANGGVHAHAPRRDVLGSG